ncbi:hypothetical protein ACJX0J_007651, partial [Zea mays]
MYHAIMLPRAVWLDDITHGGLSISHIIFQLAWALLNFYGAVGRKLAIGTANLLGECPLLDKLSNTASFLKQEVLPLGMDLLVNLALDVLAIGHEIAHTTSMFQENDPWQMYGP